MANKHVTFGGLGQHEVYLPTTGKGQKNRRDRRNCKFYDSATKNCSKIQNKCVGPAICKKFAAGKPESSCHNKHIGAIVYSKGFGRGEIISISGDICSVQFAEVKMQYKYPEILKKVKKP